MAIHRINGNFDTDYNYGPQNPNRNTNGNSALQAIAMQYGINISDCYITDEDGNKVIDNNKLQAKIKEAEREAQEKVAIDNASQADSFEYSKKSTEEDIVAPTADKKMDKIEETHKKDIVNAENTVNKVSDENKAGEEAKEAIEDATEFYNFITGASEQTIIARAAESINKVEVAVDLAAKSVEEENKGNNFFVESTDNDGANNYFANNPFMDSAIDTSDIEEDEEIAA